MIWDLATAAGGLQRSSAGWTKPSPVPSIPSWRITNRDAATARALFDKSRPASRLPRLSRLPCLPREPIMNIDPPSSSAGPSVPGSSRKERGAIAAQARKQRCSEERPKCANCVRMKLDCKYREPLPTKKDKTLVEILERLRSLEGKVDELSIRGIVPSSSHGRRPTHPSQEPGPSSTSIETSQSKSWPPFSDGDIPSSAVMGRSEHPQYEYVSSAHKILSWPFVQRVLAATPFESAEINFASLHKDGLAMLMGLRPHSATLPLDTLDRQAPDHLSPLDPSISGPQEMASSPTRLSWDMIHSRSKAFFDTFNLMYPIIDRHSFRTQILPLVSAHGFDNTIDSTLALLVLCLGEVAIAGIGGDPLVVFRGRPSGMKGGTPGRPPGLVLFNEARKRMGFNLTEYSIENVQLFALASLYYGSCCLHSDFWRMTSSASLACQALLTSKPDELDSPRADLVRRLFWHCSIMETCLCLEFNIPSTGLHALEGMVGLPDFSAVNFSEEDYISNQASHFQEHFASHIVLRRLSVEFNATLSNAFGGTDNAGGSRMEEMHPSAVTTIKQLAAQLDQWRGLLPDCLSWTDGSFDSCIGTIPDSFGHPAHPQQAPGGHLQVIFTADLDAPATNYLFAEDIQTAMLQTRYFYLKHAIHRPYIFKALHHPERMTQEDAEGVAICLRSSLLWPIAMAPIRDKKRLVPCIVFWTQNFFGILIILHLSRQVPILMRIISDLLNDQFVLDAKKTIRLYLDWIRDLKDIDANAMWCWSVVESLFPLET
ncbi:hypothetical protein SUNI508_08995 [Seiridium unicorne]|uniref:Zn(2)-C6 fungal-type domain-containing protein n=1 Tax=Seiridium unicorne TaxID=138068 RepID=A0ABR2USB0_9PEZI